MAPGATGVGSESSFWQMLVDKRTGQTPKVPESRFNIDAHYHEKLDRPGSFHVPGGYFLDGRPGDFDPTFFNITPVEAQWLDPQQRKTLSVTLCANHMNTAKLGILSPASTCHTFDASADGYGRAEGAGALFLKRLSDAVRDGDPIRRGHPLLGCQHTARESPTRVKEDKGESSAWPKALSRAMNDAGLKSKPLLIGALKPNIGHSEAASGIFAVMKAALIPGVALLQLLNPEIKEDDWNVRVNANTVPWPEDSAARRASVSSFGYGGTNDHVIIESVDTLYPWYRHGQPKRPAAYDHRCAVPLLLCLSAHDNATLWKNVEAGDYYAADLAHTLNLHRTMFSSRAFAIAREDRIGGAFARDALRPGTVPKRPATNAGFLFTGQGAQWTGMFQTHALTDYPLVMDIITRLDLVLQRLDPQPTFRIAEMLTSGGHGDGASRVNDCLRVKLVGSGGRADKACIGPQFRSRPEEGRMDRSRRRWKDAETSPKYMYAAVGDLTSTAEPISVDGI
ncbi:thiolase-like protein [Colletotrichum zoysiae]|uniref:Thiolase-like protein n=1 Tax=Colletotrichum zoysiae TaxID=1216348 RepID=A0AAD9H8E8_9PEZI|nr:thiolase-like protein [Colletotrichum zoysiae]